MKKMKKSTWISWLCILAALIASQLYRPLQTEKAETVTTVHTVTPAPTAALEKPPSASVPSAAAHPKTPTYTETSAPASSAAATPSPSPTPSPLSFSLPAPGEVQTPYSNKTLVFFPSLREWRCHLGMDFLPSETDAVFAAAAGKVIRIYEDHLYGTTLVLQHTENLCTKYSSLASVCVSEGDTLAGGAELGRMGDTAPAEPGVHLHFSVEKDGTLIDPFSIG